MSHAPEVQRPTSTLQAIHAARSIIASAEITTFQTSPALNDEPPPNQPNDDPTAIVDPVEEPTTDSAKPEVSLFVCICLPLHALLLSALGNYLTECFKVA
jgi:hypothetical protein